MQTKRMGRPKLYRNEVKADVTDRQAEALRQAAEAREVPMSQVLRELIDRHLIGAQE